MFDQVLYILGIEYILLLHNDTLHSYVQNKFCVSLCIKKCLQVLQCTTASYATTHKDTITWHTVHTCFLKHIFCHTVGKCYHCMPCYFPSGWGYRSSIHHPAEKHFLGKIFYQLQRCITNVLSFLFFSLSFLLYKGATDPKNLSWLFCVLNLVLFPKCKEKA